MNDVAQTAGVLQRFPVISQALLGASAQLRNMASMGGNLCQRVLTHSAKIGRRRAAWHGAKRTIPARHSWNR